MFIVIEGIDGSGKGTQVGALCRDLRDYSKEYKISKQKSIIETREPSDSRIGKLIKDYLKGDELIDPSSLALLFTSDRFNNLYINVIPYLQKNSIVISERYVYSTIAYQGAENTNISWICNINEGIVTPDLVIYLDIDPHEAIERIKNNYSFRGYEQKEFFEERIQLLDIVRENYLDIVNKKIKLKKKFKFLETNFVIINGLQDKSKITAQIRKSVMKLFKNEYPLYSKDYVSFKEKFPKRQPTLEDY